MSGIAMRVADRDRDDAAVWRILRPAIEAGETFCAPPGGGRDAGLAYFWPEGARVWIAEEAGQPLGCSYLKPNQGGGGAHVCNAGYCTHPDAAGRGIARLMLAHSLQAARAAGYRAMQFNFVVASNTRAIATWRRAGFDEVGCLPDAFAHPRLGYVDALVLHRAL